MATGPSSDGSAGKYIFNVTPSTVSTLDSNVWCASGGGYLFLSFSRSSVHWVLVSSTEPDRRGFSPNSATNSMVTC